MRVLGIETSCDETAAAVVEDGEKVLSNIIHSQLDLHRAYGGVIPEEASRGHIQALPVVVRDALNQAGCRLNDIDLIAVTKGPGLIGALLTGLNYAKGLAIGSDIPLVGVNHIEAHLYAALMGKLDSLDFPLLGVVLSGGHTSLVLINEVGQYQFIGATQDDAIGEAFDKVAKLLDLPYPGGPEIERLAKKGNPKAFPFHGGRIKNSPLDFSFSGLKTQVMYCIKGQNSTKASPNALGEASYPDLAASFQHAIFTDLEKKIQRAIEQYAPSSIAFGGGVTHNQTMRLFLEKAFPNQALLWPGKGMSLDNAAMIAGLGYQVFHKNNGKSDSLDLEAKARIPLA